MKNFKLSAILIIALGLLVVGCSQEAVPSMTLNSVEIKCIDNLNNAKTIKPTFPNGNDNITHYQITVENTSNKEINATAIVQKNTAFTITNLLEGKYNIKAKALIAKTSSPSSLNDYITVAETQLLNYQFSNQIKAATLNFTPATLIKTGESGDITIKVKLPHDYAVKQSVELKYTATKELEGKITNSTGDEVPEATETVSCSVDQAKAEATLVLSKNNGKFNFAPGSYKIVVDLIDEGSAKHTGVDYMRLFENEPASGVVNLQGTSAFDISLNVIDKIGNLIEIDDKNEAVVSGSTMNITISTNSSATLTYEWYRNGKLLSNGSDYTVSGNIYKFTDLNDGNHVFTILAKEVGTALAVGSRTIVVTVHNQSSEILLPPQSIRFNQIDPEIGDEEKIIIGYLDKQQPNTPKNEPVPYSEDMTLVSKYETILPEKDLYTATELGYTPVYVTDKADIPSSITAVCCGDVGFGSQFDHVNVTITEVCIAPGTTKIRGYAFKGCLKLRSVTIPDSVTSIGCEAFCGCDLITSITIPDSVTNIDSDAFKGIGITSVTIPDGITIIDCQTFEFCTSLTSVTIPSSVESIYFRAFAECSNLTSINYTGTKDQWKTIIKELDWNDATGEYTVYCSDGNLPKE